LTSDDYRLGPRDKLDEKHIMLMTESIAKLHATSYAVKIQEKETFDEFVANFKLIPFHTEDKKTMFHPLYDIALERVYRHVISTDQPKDFRDAYEKVYEKFISEPSKLLQTFVDDDPVFNIIIHGDYNRNNVMFKYNSADGLENPTGVKMFDFQWTKLASPALDLSFYLYMNLDPALFESLWDKILKFYHETLISSLAKILNCSEKDEILKQFNFDDFMKHFEDHAFYGCVISAWFLPIMLCDMKILPGILKELQKDIFSAKSKEVCLPAGGLETLVRVTENVQHAFKKGYMRRLIE
jgi:thiamine kinase-like enzyme